MEFPIEIIKQRVGIEYLKKFLGKPYQTAVKFVVDIEKEIMALGGEYHSDAVEIMIEKEGSWNQNLWGGAIYPLENNKIVYNAVMNLKPNQGHFQADISDKEIIDKMDIVLRKLIL